MNNLIVFFFLRLQRFFNNLFDEMRRTKESEIKLAESRIKEIEYCSNELKQMFSVRCSIDHSCLQLVWHDTEKPQAEENEVFKLINCPVETTPCLDNNNLEDKIHKILFLDKDFRYKCLDKMMDGVLEVR